MWDLSDGSKRLNIDNFSESSSSAQTPYFNSDRISDCAPLNFSTKIVPVHLRIGCGKRSKTRRLDSNA